jgi:hypothetical protein
MEFTRRNLVFNAVEVGSNGVYTSGVAYEDNLVSQEFGL